MQFFFLLCGTYEVLDHLAGFLQVERQFHGRESNRQPLHSVWVPCHYRLVVQSHLGPHVMQCHNLVSGRMMVLPFKNQKCHPPITSTSHLGIRGWSTVAKCQMNVLNTFILDSTYNVQNQKYIARFMMRPTNKCRPPK